MPNTSDSQSTYYRTLRKQIEQEHPFSNNTDIAYELIFHEIVTGALQAGDQIRQENLASNLDMSRTPVREALLRLEQNKYLERTAGGFQIRKPDIKDYVDFYEFRLLLEPKAAWFAARNISDDQLALLKQNMNQLKSAMAEKDKYHISLLDNRFHEIIADASNNTYLRQTILQYQDKSMFHLQIVLYESNLRFMYNKHREIYEAILRSDEAAAEAAMRSHLQLYIKNIYSAYP